MKKLFKLTQDGINELEVELNGLVAQRSEITERIKSAREMGDLAENSEYAAARGEQERTEGRITEIEHILKNVDVIKSPRDGHKVRLGSHIKLKDNGGKTKDFKVVGTVEADPLEGKVSDESPIGHALMGKKVGDQVEISSSSQTTKYVISEIT